MTPTVEDRLDALETELHTLRRRDKAQRVLLGGLLTAGLLIASVGVAGGVKRSLYLESEDGVHAMEITPDGIEFRVDQHPRMRLTVGEGWASHTILADDGAVIYSAGTDAQGSAVRLFAPEGTLRAEFSERLLDSGSGLRLYDKEGHPRVSLYSSRRGGESGLELTDPSRQPRVGIYAKPDGASVFQASTSDASAEVEISVQPQSDVVSRMYGGIPSATEGEPLLPMVFLLDGAGRQRSLTTYEP
ncbi:MAG: hypothetical protein JXX28_16560 [Deltaproteobacteria bacterium]|nr:hypothetical protein [Deltaproteobacteria bacterium]